MAVSTRRDTDGRRGGVRGGGAASWALTFLTTARKGSGDGRDDRDENDVGGCGGRRHCPGSLDILAARPGSNSVGVPLRPPQPNAANNWSYYYPSFPRAREERVEEMTYGPGKEDDSVAGVGRNGGEEAADEVPE